MTPTTTRPETGFRLRAHVLWGAALAALLVVGCGGWAALARLEGAIIAQGQLKPDQNLKEVQHRDGGIVRSIAVRQGDLVREGQALIVLDDVQTRAELQIVRGQLAEALGRQARLVAERDGLPELRFPPHMRDLSAGAIDVEAGETRLFQGNRTARESQKEQLELSIAQVGEEIRGLEARRVAKVADIGIVQAERQKLQGLFDRSLIDGNRVYAINRDWTRLQGELGEIDSAIARSRVRMSEMRLQVIAIDQNARTESQRELRVVEARLSELNERRVAIEDRLSRMEIRAPIAGRVNELFIHTVGGVITPAAKILTIVPEDVALTVEVKIAPADIDQVRPGQPARVRFTAFHRNTTPELSAVVAVVSPATVRDPTNGALHYVAELRVTSDIVGLGGGRLVAGMPVETYISTEERTALSYLAKPMFDQINRSFREQ